MEIAGTTVIVTGGAHGIGRALANELKEAGAAGIAIADRDLAAAKQVAADVGGAAFETDVSDAQSVAALVAAVEDRFGPVSIYCSNAGIGFTDAPGWTAASQTGEQWQAAWDLNVMAHVHAARALLPEMIARGSGHFLITASAAGLLGQIGDAAYSATKHAAVGYAELLAITHGDDGIGVTVLCPQGVDTRMIKGIEGGAQNVDGVLPPQQIAAGAIAAIREDRFMVLSHATTQGHFLRKAADYDRWIGGMRKFRRSLLNDAGAPFGA